MSNRHINEKNSHLFDFDLEIKVYFPKKSGECIQWKEREKEMARFQTMILLFCTTRKKTSVERIPYLLKYLGNYCFFFIVIIE